MRRRRIFRSFGPKSEEVEHVHRKRGSEDIQAAFTSSELLAQPRRVSPRFEARKHFVQHRGRGLPDKADRLRAEQSFRRRQQHHERSRRDNVLHGSRGDHGEIQREVRRLVLRGDTIYHVVWEASFLQPRRRRVEKHHLQHEVRLHLPRVQENQPGRQGPHQKHPRQSRFQTLDQRRPPKQVGRAKRAQRAQRRARHRLEPCEEILETEFASKVRDQLHRVSLERRRNCEIRRNVQKSRRKQRRRFEHRRDSQWNREVQRF